MRRSVAAKRRPDLVKLRAMELGEYILCGTLAHGHPCPPLVLGVRAGFVAMGRLGVGRATERELFAFARPATDELLAARDDELFSVSAVFPLRIKYPRPTFESVVCGACGESVLAPYAREVDGRHLCLACEERLRSRGLANRMPPRGHDVARTPARRRVRKP